MGAITVSGESAQANKRQATSGTGKKVFYIGHGSGNSSKKSDGILYATIGVLGFLGIMFLKKKKG